MVFGVVHRVAMAGVLGFEGGGEGGDLEVCEVWAWDALGGVWLVALRAMSGVWAWAIVR